MPVPFARTASQTRPTFSRDFAGLKTLDHGAGPAITFTRGTNATYFDASGTLRFAPHNAIRNSQAGGATVGVIGSGGVMPTNWAVSGAGANGITVEIATGTEDGLAYLDFKLSGTATATSVVGINTESTTHIVATDGQTWTASGYVKLAAGSLSGIAHCRLYTTGRTSGGSSVAGQVTTTGFTPTSSQLSAQRVSGARTFSDATVARVTGNWEIGYTNGQSINFTLRIAAPQLERNATASEYIPTAGTANFDQPRFDHDPATGASRGLLIEEARTNSLIYSADLGDAAWTKELGATVTTNTATAPDGTVSGDTITFSATNANRVQQTAGAAVDAQTWTFSVWLKGTGTARILADSSTGVGGAGELNITLTSTWTRYSVSVTYSSPTGNRRAAIIWRTGNTATSVDAWGAQFEQGAFPTSYIPTTSAAATRSADSAVVTPISSFYNQSEGTLFAEATLRGITSGSFPRVVQFDEASSSDNRFNILCTSTPAASAEYRTSGVGQLNTTETAITLGTVFRTIAAVATNNGRVATNGALAGSDDTSLTMNSANTRMRIGTEAGGSFFTGHIRKIAYYPRRLSNTLLQQLTT